MHSHHSLQQSELIHKIRTALESVDPNDRLILLDDNDIRFSRELKADELQVWSVDAVIELMKANLIMTRREYMEYKKSLALFSHDMDQVHLSKEQSDTSSAYDSPLSYPAFEELGVMDETEDMFFSGYLSDSLQECSKPAANNNKKEQVIQEESPCMAMPVFNEKTNQYEIGYLQQPLLAANQEHEPEKPLLLTLQTGEKISDAHDETNKPSSKKRKRRGTRVIDKNESDASTTAIKEVKTISKSKRKKRKTAGNDKKTTVKKSKTMTAPKKTARIIKATNYVYAHGDNAGKYVTGLSDLELEKGIKNGSFITTNSYTLKRLVWMHNGGHVSSEDLKDTKKVEKLIQEEKIGTAAKYNRMQYLQRKKNPGNSTRKGKGKYVYAQGESAGEAVADISTAELKAGIKNGSIITEAVYKGRRLVWEHNGELVSDAILKDKQQIDKLQNEGKVIKAGKYRKRKSYHKKHDKDLYAESEKQLATIIQTLPSPEFFNNKKKIKIDGENGKQIKQVARHVLNGAGISLRCLERRGSGLYKLKITDHEKYTEKWNRYNSGSGIREASAAGIIKTTGQSVNKGKQFSFFYKPPQADESAVSLPKQQADSGRLFRKSGKND